MTAISLAPSSAFGARASFVKWSNALRVPLEAWSRRRRWTVALLIAAFVFALGAHGWMLADLTGAEASRVALSSAVQRVADAKRALSQLPSLRAQVAALPARTSSKWTSADDVRLVSQVAADNAVTLLAVEPGAANGAGIESMRALQITARTDFIHLMAFLRALSDLPVLVVPADVVVRRDGAVLSMSATLRVFNVLSPVPASAQASMDAVADEEADLDNDEDVVFFDPFSLPQMQAAGAVADVTQLRLVGLMRDAARALALLDTSDGITTAVPGQQIGPERVTKLDALGVTLANGNATRTLMFTEAS